MACGGLVTARAIAGGMYPPLSGVRCLTFAYVAFKEHRAFIALYFLLDKKEPSGPRFYKKNAPGEIAQSKRGLFFF